MKFDLEEVTVYFPYEFIYPEQYKYMQELKRALDAPGHCLLEMPTGTGKTITLLSLVTAYQRAHPELGKLIYCTRTVPEMEKVLVELRELIEYRERYITGSSSQILAVGLSSRKNLCIHKGVQDEATRESVDAKCRKLTAPWVRERALAAGGGRQSGTEAAAPAAAAGPSAGPSAAAPAAAPDSGDAAPEVPDIEVCGFFEGHSAAGNDAVLPPGVYTLHDLRQYGRKKGWCPYYLARHMVAYANVVVWSYQYMIDPKVSQMVSRELEKECVVVFDEAHNIDNVCIEALSINLRDATLSAASRNLTSLQTAIQRTKQVDARRLQQEYERLVDGLAAAGVLHAAQRGDLANPALPQDILNEAVPGNIRRAEHFVMFLRRFVEYLKTRVTVTSVVSQSCSAFLEDVAKGVAIDGKTLRFCYDRLTSLIKTLEIHNTDDFWPLQLVADFGTLIGTYDKGFAVIIEPWDDRLPSVPDPVIQLACLDASLAMKPVFDKFQSVVITSGTLSPIDLYPRLLDFNPVSVASLQMTLTRECLCPVVLTRGADQMPVSTRFEARSDESVLRNYGQLLIELAKVVPDGVVCFFVSYLYMDRAVNAWHGMGVLDDIMAHKLIFIETQDVVETTLALDNFRRACDCGRGGMFFSVARGKVAEGIDFDRHYGRAVVMMGVPYQYTLSRILQARLEYLQQTFQIKDSDFLAFDAVRQASQCVGRVIRSKADYGMMVFADKRYQRHDKRDKLPRWITAHLSNAHLDLSTDMLVHIAREFMRSMAQPLAPAAIGKALLSADDLAARARGPGASATASGAARVAPIVAGPGA